MEISARPTGVERASRPWYARALVPDDHGAYAMLLIPLVVGLVSGSIRGLSGQTGPGAFLLLAITMVALFFAGEPVSIIAKPRAGRAARQNAGIWLVIYLAIAVAGGGALLFAWQLWGLAWFALPAGAVLLMFLVAARLRKQRSMPFRLAGILGLTMSAPAAYYTATGRIDGLAWGLWAACAVYFCGAIFNVRAWFEANRQKKAGIETPRVPRWLLGVTLAYIAVGIIVLAGATLAGDLPWGASLALAPLAARIALGLRRPPVYIPIKQLGFLEFGQSFLFAMILVYSIR